MKTLLKKALTVAGIFLLGISSLASAQTAGPDGAHVLAADVLPSDIDIVYELNTSEKNPLEDLFLQQAGEIAAEGADEEALVELLKNVLDDNTLTFAMNLPDSSTGADYYSYSEPDMYVAFSIGNEDFTKLLEYSAPEQIERYGENDIYAAEDNAYFTLIGDLFIMTPEVEQLRELLNRYSDPETGTLTENESYTATRSRDLDGSFLNAYINPAAFFEESGSAGGGDPLSSLILFQGNSFAQEALSALEAEGISVAQTEEGFPFGVSLEGNGEKLSSLDLNFNKYNFVPALYTNISGRDLIYYEEKNNTRQRMEDMLRMLDIDTGTMSEFTEWKTQFKIDSGIDLERDVLPLLNGRNMITVHNAGQVLPALTLIMDIGNNTSKAGPLLEKLVEYLKKEFPEGSYQFGIYSAGGTAFYEFTIDMAGWSSDSQLMALPSEMTTIHLRMAVTNDGLVVVSTLPDLADMFRTGGLTDNEPFAQAFTNRSEEIDSVVYLSIDNLQNYINVLMDASEAPSDMKEAVNAFLEPWNDLFGKAYADADSLWVKGMLKVDVNGFQDFGETLGEMFNLDGAGRYEDYSMPIVSLTPAFCDVRTEDWFSSYVNDLASGGIISGYEDGCFRPDNAITRAEFITLLMKATGKDAAVSNADRPFTDVPPYPGEWYSGYVIMANANGFIDGYEDGTFRPDAEITRAEAVQILFNMSNRLPAVQVVDQPLESLISFEDVHTYDWFFTPVVAAYHYGLVQGVSPEKFEPDRSITRAEAAKIVKLFLDLEGYGGLISPADTPESIMNQ